MHKANRSQRGNPGHGASQWQPYQGQYGIDEAMVVIANAGRWGRDEHSSFGKSPGNALCRRWGGGLGGVRESFWDALLTEILTPNKLEGRADLPSFPSPALSREIFSPNFLHREL